MTAFKEKNKRYGLLGTILFHAFLLVLFLFFGMSYTIPPPAEEGMLLDFGNSELGSGQVEELIASNPETSEAIAIPTEDVITQETEESVNLKKPEEIRHEVVKQPEKKEEKKEERKPDPSKMFSANNEFQTSGGEGSDNDKSNSGTEDGSKDGYKDGTTTFGSKGVSYSLSGRSLLGIEAPKDDSQYEGKVVVRVTVNKEGKVIRATPGERGSTTTSKYLYELAKKAAEGAKFSQNPNSAEIQQGTITFNFILE